MLPEHSNIHGTRRTLSLYYILIYSNISVYNKDKYTVYCVKKYVFVPVKVIYFIILFNSTFIQNCFICKQVPQFVIEPQKKWGGQ